MSKLLHGILAWRIAIPCFCFVLCHRISYYHQKQSASGQNSNVSKHLGQYSFRFHIFFSSSDSVISIRTTSTSTTKIDRLTLLHQLNIKLSRNITVTKLYCHICKDGGQECIEVSERCEFVFIRSHFRCHTCGRPLVA